MQAIIRKHVPREFICAADLKSALSANHPHSRNYSADFLMMYMALQGGLRSGTVSLLRLQDIIEIEIDEQTLRIRVSCNMYRFKARGEGWARIKNFSGYIDQPNNPIYHLHHRILELTNGAMGLIRCNSIEESMYGWNNDPAMVGLVAVDVTTNNYTTIINYLHEQDDEDLRETFLFYRGALTSTTSRHAQMVRRRFSHYPPWLLKRFVFHSLRAGFYVTTVFNIAKHNAWNVGQALDFAKLLGEWRIHTDPSVWYGGGKGSNELKMRGGINNLTRSSKSDLLQSAIDHSLLSEGNPNFIINVLETPERAHRLHKAPSIEDEDNVNFKERQQTLTVRVAKEMIKMAVKARRIHLTLNEGYGDRDLLGMVNSLDLAVASFYNRVVEEEDDYETAMLGGWDFIEEDIWPGLAKSREEIKRYIHGNICQQVLDGEVDLVKDV